MNEFEEWEENASDKLDDGFCVILIGAVTAAVLAFLWWAL